jgi:hypothetical protein
MFFKFQNIQPGVISVIGRMINSDKNAPNIHDTCGILTSKPSVKKK